MGHMWVGFYILCCCFMVSLLNCSASCDSLRRLGPLENGFQRLRFVEGSGDVETERLERDAENSLRAGKGSGSGMESNVGSAIQSSKPNDLGDRREEFVRRRVLGETVTRIDARVGSVNAPRKRKRVGIDRREGTYLKQSVQKGLKNKGVQIYNTQKERQGRRSNGTQDLFKSHEDISKVSQAQSGVKRRKQKSPNDAIPEEENGMDQSGGESKGNELRTGFKSRRPVMKSIRRKEKIEEENQNSATLRDKEGDNSGDTKEDYKRKGLQNGVEGKRPVSKSIRKVEKEEEEELRAVIQEKKENDGGDNEQEDKGKGLQNEVKDKRPVSRSIPKDDKEEEEEDINGTTQESKEKTSGRYGDEEVYKRKAFHGKVKGKRPSSKSIRKDKREEEEEEDTNTTIQEIKETNISGGEEGYERKGLQNDIKGKRTVSKPVHKDVKDQDEDDLNAPSEEDKEKHNIENREEDYMRKGFQNQVKRKRQASKSTHKEEKEGQNPMPESEEKKDPPLNEDDSKKNEMQAEAKEEISLLPLVGKYEKKVNDDGLELAEEFLNQEDQSAPANFNNTKKGGESRDESRETQDLKEDKVELDQTITDKQTRRDNVRGKAMTTQMPKKIVTDEFTEQEIKDDDIMSRENSKFSESEEANTDESANSGPTEDDESEIDPTDKQSISNTRNPAEENADESADDDMEEGNASETVLSKKRSKSRFQNPEKENADESEENDVEEDNQSKSLPTKKQSKSNFQNSEEENADESADNNVKVENQSKTVTKKQSKASFSNPEEENADGLAVEDVTEDNESEAAPIRKQSKSNFVNSEEDNVDKSADDDLKDEDDSETVAEQRQSRSKFSMQEEEISDESVNNDTKEDAESETIPHEKQSSSEDKEESSSNSTEPAEGSDEEFSDFIQEIQDLPSKFQDTAGKVADKLLPEIQKFSNQSKVYFNRANEGITEGFKPLIGNKYAPFFASVISYIFVLVPLVVVIILFDQIRTYFPLQKAILYANIYLAAYFATLIFASFLIGMEPMGFFFRNSMSGYIYLQLLEALGYILYLILQFLNLISSFSKGPIQVKLAAFLQCGVSIFIGLHYYVTVFHRAMAQKAPHTSWKIYLAYTIVFSILCLFSRIKHGKKEYIQEHSGNGSSKKH